MWLEEPRRHVFHKARTSCRRFKLTTHPILCFSPTPIPVLSVGREEKSQAQEKGRGGREVYLRFYCSLFLSYSKLIDDLFAVLLLALNLFCYPYSSLCFACDHKWCLTPPLSLVLTLRSCIFSSWRKQNGCVALAASQVKITPPGYSKFKSSLTCLYGVVLWGFFR